MAATNPEIVGKFLSTLPEDDDHPYRTGPWRPQTTEWDADDLTAVEGEIPTDLDGVYLRNTENPLHPALKFYHPFDGDGMVHVIGFRDGKAFYRNRFIRTDGFAEENEAGGPLWPGLAEPVQIAKRDKGWGARTLMKDASSTDVLVHRGTALTSFYQCGDLYRVDPYSGDTLGKAQWGGAFPFDWGVSAHPKVDDRTGELLFFNYSKEAPYMHYGVVDAERPTRALRRRTRCRARGCRTTWRSPETTRSSTTSRCSGIPSCCRPTSTCRASTRTCRRGSPSFPAAAGPTRSGGSRPIRRSCCTSPTPTRTATRSCSTASSRANPLPSTHSAVTSGRRRFGSWPWTGCRPGCTAGGSTSSPVQTREEQLSDSITEFGMINGGYAGPPYRYTYAATGKPGLVPVRRPGQARPADRRRGAVRIRGRRVRQRDGDGPARRQHRRGRRIPGHAHHRHERRRLVLPGVRRRQGGRRTGVQTGSAGTDLQRHPLDVGGRLGAAALARDRRRGGRDRAVGGSSPEPNAVARMLGTARRRVDAAGHAAGPAGRDAATAEFTARLPISNSVLTRRLRSLTGDGLLDRRVYQTNPTRAEYLITPRSRSLWPMLLSIWEWERRWVPDHAESVARHAPRGVRRRLRSPARLPLLR